MQTLESLLEECPFLKGFAPPHLALLAGCASNAAFRPGEYLFREGEEADRFYAIRHGRAAVQLAAGGHGAITIQTVESGEMLGWSWLLPPYVAHFDARALEPIRATAFDGACIRGKCVGDPALGYEIMKRVCEVMAERLEAARVQILDIYGYRAGQ